MNAMVPTGNTALTPTSMESAIKLAEMMARGKLVPQHLHNSPGDCLMVIEASMRWGMSPFAVAQCTSVIQGKLMFEGKLVAAALNTSGILASRLDYEFSGANGQRAVTVRGTLRGETKAREVTVHLAEAKTSNSLWTRQPDQQLVYAGTRVWARRHAPEVMLGVYAPEEFDRADAFDGPTIEATSEASTAREAINAAVPMRAAAAPMQRPPSVTAKAPPRSTSYDPLDPLLEPDGRKWMVNLRAALEAATSRVEVEAIGAHETVGSAILNAPPAIKRDISEMLAEHYKRIAEADDGTEAAEPEDDFPGDLPDVEIAGQDKVLAG